MYVPKMDYQRKSPKSAAYAVLMGDIVGSASAHSAGALHLAFNRAIAWANKAYAADIASPLTITLGDEFQGLLASLARAFDLAQALRLKLVGEGVSCRFVIGLVWLETPLNRERAWNMMGPGLSEARAALNDKRTANAYRFSLPNEPLVQPLMDAVGDSITQVEQDWTETQRRYFAATRGDDRTNAKIAKRLGVSERAMYKVLRAARADFHGRQSRILRETLTGLDKAQGLTR